MPKIDEINGSWERLQRIIENEGMNINQFATSIGLQRSESLYQIKRGCINITRSIATRIVDKYPYYSFPWLVTGCGTMYANADDNTEYIPFYDCDIRDLPLTSHIAPHSHIFIPHIAQGDIAMRYYGDDMMPSVPNGTVLILQRKRPEEIVYGREFVVVEDEIISLRRVRQSHTSGRVILESTCRDYYKDREIEFRSIRDLYAISGKLILPNQK
jgi:hypothetical protein